LRYDARKEALRGGFGVAPRPASLPVGGFARMKIARWIGVVLALAIPLVMYVLGGSGSRSAALSDPVYQFSSKCATRLGICYVPAQPLGSPCWCGSDPGTIVP
jgi:hypothetical protein